MAFVLEDFIKETTETTGTDDLVLEGAVSQFNPFSSALSDGDTTIYGLIASDGSKEVGLGTYVSASNTLQRTTIRSSTDGDAKLDLPAGQHIVFIGPDADGMELAYSALQSSDIGTNVQAYDADTAKLDTAQDWTAKQTFNLFEAAAGTLTADSPFVFSQTWNNAAVAFTGLKINVTNTASASGANVIDAVVSGSHVFSITKTGEGLFGYGSVSSPAVSLIEYPTGMYFSRYDIKFSFDGVVGPYFSRGDGYLTLPASWGIAWSYNASGLNPKDIILWRRSAGILDQRSTVHAQTYAIYNTYVSGSNYERAKLAWESNRFVIGTEAETGTKRGITFDASDLIFSSLPTSDPSVAGQLWLDGTSLKVSAG